MPVSQQLQLRIPPQIVPPLVHKLKQLHQLTEDNHPDLLVAHQPVYVYVEDVAIYRVFLDLVGLGFWGDAVDAVLEVRCADLTDDALEDFDSEGGEMCAVGFVDSVEEGLSEGQEVV